MSNTNPKGSGEPQEPQALIQITEYDGKRTVNARELHAFLESKQDFSTWMKYRIAQYDFVENVDFVSFPQIYGKPQGGRPSIEYALTINMAKELSMVEGNEKGKQARRYFIAREEQAIILLNRQLKQAEERTVMPDARRKPITFDNLPAAVGQLLDEVNLIKKLLVRPAEPVETYLSPKKTAEMLDVNPTTLWRWNKRNYLIHIQVGGKRRYKMSDIQKILS